MPVRLIAILPDESVRRDIDLVRALYDPDVVDKTPPHVPLVAPFEESTKLADLADMVGLIVGLRRPYLLELAKPERFFDGDLQLLQLVGGKGSDETQRIATALYRDVIPHQMPADPSDTPVQRTAMTVGRFHTETEVTKAAAELGDKAYFLVVSQVGILEEHHDEGWTVQRTLEVGAMIERG